MSAPLALVLLSLAAFGRPVPADEPSVVPAPPACPVLDLRELSDGVRAALVRQGATAVPARDGIAFEYHLAPGDTGIGRCARMGSGPVERIVRMELLAQGPWSASVVELVGMGTFTPSPGGRGGHWSMDRTLPTEDVAACVRAWMWTEVGVRHADGPRCGIVTIPLIFPPASFGGW